MDECFPWAFVDGASQGRTWSGGAGGILHLSISHSIHFVASLGDVSNNSTEFAAIKVLLCLSHSIGILHLHIYGDSKLVINSLKLGKPPWNIFLLPLYDDIDRIRVHFQRIIFTHICQECNSEADLLSKKSLLLRTGYMDKWENFHDSLVFLGISSFFNTIFLTS